MSVLWKPLRRRTAGAWIAWDEKPQLARAAGLGLSFLLGAASAGVRVLGGCMPFGIAMVARAGPGAGGFVCLLGAMLGYFSAGGMDEGLRCVAACALVFTAAFCFQELKVSRRSWFMPSVAAAVTSITGVLSVYENILTPAAIASVLADMVLAGGCTVMFDEALTGGGAEESESDERRRIVALTVLFACLLASLNGITVLRVISVGRFISVLTTMTVSASAGSVPGCAAGVILGLTADLVDGTPFHIVAYGVSGLLAGVFSRRGRLLLALTFVIADATVVLWAWKTDIHIAALYETFAASVVFMLLPSRLLTRVGTLVRPPTPGAGESGLRRYTARRAHDLAEAFRELYDAVRESAESNANDADVASVFDRAADSVCVGCKNRDLCWQTESLDTLNILNDATRPMLERGRLVPADLPERFMERCMAPDGFIGAVNAELRAMLYRRQLRARLSENRTAVYGQFQSLARIMDTVSEELQGAAGPDPLAERRLLRYLNGLDVDAEAAVFRDRSGRLRCVIEGGNLGTLLRDPNWLDKLSGLAGVRLCRPAAQNRGEGRIVLAEAEPLSVTVGVAAVRKEGEKVSGDRGTYFKTDAGVLCVVLSDGMGSGEEAARESVSAVRTLERFLRAGLEPGAAMRLLNSVFLLRGGGEDWGYATVDLMCIDLFSGEACFYKYGAAPSYVRTGKLVRRVRGQSMAAGVYAGEGENPDVVRMRLRPGSVALIASDGVVTAEKDTWLRDILAGFEGEDIRALAKNTLEAAVRQFGQNDDMTVLAVRVDARS